MPGADRCKYHERLAKNAFPLSAGTVRLHFPMKEYRLLAWPELPAEYRRTAHRRALSEMSQRYMSVAKLVEVSGLKKAELRAFLEMLDGRAVLTDRDTTAPDSFLDSIRPLGWLRRAMSASHDRR